MALGMSGHSDAYLLRSLATPAAKDAVSMHKASMVDPLTSFFSLGLLAIDLLSMAECTQSSVVKFGIFEEGQDSVVGIALSSPLSESSEEISMISPLRRGSTREPACDAAMGLCDPPCHGLQG